MSCICRMLVLSVLGGLIATSSLAQQAPAATPAAATDVLAVVNGHQITRMEIEQFQQLRSQLQGDTDQPQLMRELVTLKLLAQEAKKLQLDQDSAVQTQIGIRVDNVLARAMIEKYAAENIKISDEAIRQHYEASKEHYTTDEQVTASHILVQTEAEAQEVLQELREGKDFAEVAKARSMGPSASRGGSLGTFGRGSMVGPFESVAFSLQKGAIGGPVQTQFGYHVIKVTDRIPAHLQPLESVKDEIEKTLMAQRIGTYLDDLLDQAEVQIQDPTYAFE